MTVGIEEHMFEVTCGQIVVADPCYVDRDDAPGYEILGRDSGIALTMDAAPGTWHAEIETADDSQTHGWGERVSILRAHRAGHGHGVRGHVGNVGVDSGQMAVISRDTLPVDYDRLLEQYQTGEDGKWENHQMLALAGEAYADMYDDPRRQAVGVVSSTGYGDGVYPVYVARNERGQVVAVEVRFLEEDEEEETCSDCGAPTDECYCGDED